MDRLIRSQDLPSSPWAARYPLDYTTFTFDKKNRSLLAPDYPRIDDPKYYDQDPNSTTPKRPRSNADIDKLLWTEKFQQKRLWGVRAWQVAALNRYLRFSPETGFVSGGHRPPPANARPTAFSLSSRLSNFRVPRRAANLSRARRTELAVSAAHDDWEREVYSRERIKVDETRWFPFLRRDRWFDWAEVTPPPESSPGRTWSADDPELWGILCITLELVDRILKALIRDQHAGDYWSDLVDVFGPPPEPDTLVLLSHAAEVKICEKRRLESCAWNFTVTRGPGVSNTRLSDLLSSLIWGFQDAHSSHAATHSPPNVERLRERQPYGSLIVLSVSKFKSLLNPNLTLGELCTLQVDLAVVIIHELGHALLAARYDGSDNFIGNRFDKKRSGKYMKNEPFLDAQGIAEAGHYFEDTIFGGIPNVEPQGDGAPEPPPLIYFIQAWPWPGYTGAPAAPNSAFKEDGSLTTIYHLPSTWPSQMLAESFWNDETKPKKSENFFHCNRVLVMEAKNRDGHRSRPREPRLADLDSVPLPFRYPEDKVLADDWRERNRLWEAHRAPWYDFGIREWGNTPWAELSGRQKVFRFAEAFAKKDGIACAGIASYFVSQLDWSGDLEAYASEMPTKDNPVEFWAWHVIGLLMLASLPIRRIPLTRHVPTVTWFLELPPSRAAAAAGHLKTVYVPHFDASSDPESSRTSACYNPIRRPEGGPPPAGDFTQLDFLELVDDVLGLVVTRDAVVHAGLLDAILAARAALRADRTRLAAGYPAHASLWASAWYFRFPEYDPVLCSFVDGRWRRRDVARRRPSWVGRDLFSRNG
ncbi:hypothetical protein F4802DRAFT_602667 [Xylaria palmicola]|nr:hypothetical protein F4802DRAFT_602667 [Xylaria palmicola]